MVNEALSFLLICPGKNDESEINFKSIVKNI